jgi:hypothetical protein
MCGLRAGAAQLPRDAQAIRPRQIQIQHDPTGLFERT